MRGRDKACIGGRDDEVAGERQAEPAARRSAVHPDDDRLPHAPDAADDLMKQGNPLADRFRRPLGIGSNHAEIGARHEVAPLGRQRDGLDRLITLGAPQRRDQGLRHRRIERVHPVGPIEPDIRDTFCHIEKYWLVSFLRSRNRTSPCSSISPRSPV